MPEIVERTKRPVKVRTRLWTGDNEAEMQEFCGTGNFHAVPPEDRIEDSEITAEVFDELHSTWVGVYTGHHVVCGVRNEFYPIDAAVLEETYEPAEADADALLAASELEGAHARLLAACDANLTGDDDGEQR